MSSPRVKRTIALSLNTMLLLAAVPSAAFCICNDSTPKCCQENNIPTQGPGCCQSQPGKTASDQLEDFFLMQESPSGSSNLAHSCKHLENASAPVSATLPFFLSGEAPGYSLGNCGPATLAAIYGCPAPNSLVGSTSPKADSNQAPVYLLCASLII